MASYFIHRPIFAWVIALLITLSGILALRALPVSQYPEVSAPALSISAVYPGANAEMVENTVTTRIEQQLIGLENLQSMESTSDSAGRAQISLTFRTGTDINNASVEAQSRLRRVEVRLPDAVRQQGIEVNRSRRNYLMLLSFISPNGQWDSGQLGDYVNNNVLDAVRRINGVGEVQLFGSEYALRVWLNPQKLAQYKLTPNEVGNIIREAGVLITAGDLGKLPSAGGQEWVLTMVDPRTLKQKSEVEQLILRTNNAGNPLRLADVARVEWGASDYSVSSRLNGQNAASVGIRLSTDGNAVETAQAVKTLLTEMSKSFPESISWTVSSDSSIFVDISIREVVKTVIEAFVLVFIVMLLFLQSLRAALIPMLVVPVSLLGTFAGLWALGYTVNVLTLFAMVLAIGIVVDDAIVVIENVERLMHDHSLSAKAATIQAMQQIFGAIIGITVVLTAVFLPMAFFGDAVGRIYQQFSITLVMSMLLSALMALTLTPALCANLLQSERIRALESHHHWGHRLLHGFAEGFHRLTQSYQRHMHQILGKSARMMVLYLLIAGIGGYLISQLPKGFLPEEDQGTFTTLIQLPAGASQERTLSVVRQIEDYFAKQPAIDKVVSIIGQSFNGRGQNNAMIFVRLKLWSERKGREHHVSEIVRQARGFFSRIDDASVFAVIPPPIPELSALGGFDLRLKDQGSIGRANLALVREEILSRARQDPRLSSVREQGLPEGLQLSINIDQAKANSLAIDRATLTDTLSTLLGSRYVADVVRPGRSSRIVVQMDSALQNQREHLLNIEVRNQKGQMIALSAFATLEYTTGANLLSRYNGVPAFRLSGAPANGLSTGEALQAMEEHFQQVQKNASGIGYEWSGPSYEEKIAGNKALQLFTLSVLVVFLALAALYESWSMPLIILLVVPLGLIGAVLSALLGGFANDIFFSVALVAIIGLASKNSILIAEFARQLEAQGTPTLQAVITACQQRFRPIVMTSVAFIFGVLPLALSTGAGAEGRRAIGWTVMSGMISATVLSLLIAPVLYWVIRRYVRKREDQSSLVDPLR